MKSNMMKVSVCAMATLALAMVVSCESDFCKARREACEATCDGFVMHFDCKDDRGSRGSACSCGERLPTSGGDEKAGSSSGGTRRTEEQNAEARSSGARTGSHSGGNSHGSASAMVSCKVAAFVYSCQILIRIKKQSALVSLTRIVLLNSPVLPVSVSVSILVSDFCFNLIFQVACMFNISFSS